MVRMVRMVRSLADRTFQLCEVLLRVALRRRRAVEDVEAVGPDSAEELAEPGEDPGILLLVPSHGPKE